MVVSVKKSKNEGTANNITLKTKQNKKLYHFLNQKNPKAILNYRKR